MNRTRESHRRPYVRTRRSSRSPHGGASRLADLAGRAPAPSVDALEPRQLLFSLTITPDLVDPFTGVGTATAYFGYVLPFLTVLEGDLTEVEDPGEPVFERFDDVLDEDLPPLGSPRVNVPSGTIMPDSNLRFTHNVLPGSDFQFREEATDPDQGRLFVRLDQTEQFTMQVAFSEETTTEFLGLKRFEFEVQAAAGSIQGLNLDNMRLTLRFLGQVVATFEGAALGALNTTAPGTGVGLFEVFVPSPVAPGEFLSFDEVQISATGGPNDAFFVDNVGWDLPSQGIGFTGFSSQDFIDARIFGARVTIAGPVGTSVQVLDLYGREMRATIMLGIPPGAEVTIVDSDGDGVPNWNDGIGSFVLSGFDETSTMTVIGGVIEQGFSEDADFNQGGPQGFNLTIVDNIMGLYDDFETQARFGYGLSADPEDPRVIGLPPGPGSVVVGSPWARPNESASAYNPGGFGGPMDFNRPDQGVFARGGQNVGSVAIHGVVHGSSRFEGFVGRVALGYFPGSATVKGDLGEFVVGSDAGMWVREDDIGPLLFRTTKTTGQLVVERTIGEVAIAGRSLMDITVIGDLSAPGARPPRDIYQYWEREFVYGIDFDAEERDTILATFLGADFMGERSAVPPGAPPVVLLSGQSPWFGDSYFRNDSILSAEFVGSPGTAAEIRGEIDFGDPKNTAEDRTDVFAFAVDGTRPVHVQGLGASLSVRIVDSDGRTLAAQEFDDGFANTLEYDFQWMPTAPGVYYLVLNPVTVADNQAQTGFAYVFELSGLAPVTFGAYRTGAFSGRPADFTMSTQPFAPTDNAISLLSGSMGAARIGTAYINGSGDETDPSEIMNRILAETEGGLDDEMDFAGGTIAVDNGGLYQLLTGSDIEGVALDAFPTIVLRGDLGVVVTGLSPVIGIAPEQGDLRNVNLEIGGRIGMLDIKGGVGHSRDNPEIDVEFDLPETVNISTGLRGGSGDIGFFRVGGHVYANRMNVSTSPGSTVGGFAISQDIAFSEEDPFWGISGEGRPAGDGVTWNVGAGSDLRFVAIPRIDLEAAVDVAQTIRVNQAIEIVEDSGARVRITVRGGGGTTGNPVGFLRTMPVDGSEGVAIGEIEVNLAPGLGLEIEGLGGGSGDIISIGRIQITGGDAASNIRFIGNIEIDVWQIFQSDGELNFIENLTPNGDIVAIDVPDINTVRIQRGDLGRTQVPAWGPRLIGPFLGIGGDGGEGAEFAPFTIEGPLDNDVNGNLYRPVNDTNFAPGNAYLTDVGSPVDPWLNGLIVRTGSVALVEVGGAVGDVMAIGGDVGLVHANFQERGAFGAFNGVFGNIYGNDVIEVNIGDGMLARGDTPIAEASIVADDDIFRIRGVLQGGATLSGVIAAGNNVLNDRAATFDTDGIEVIQVDGGRYYLAEILTGDLNSFWADISGYVTPAYFGDVEVITGDNTDFIRSDITTINLQTFRLATGVYDASFIQTLESATLIEAAMFMNSMTLGSLREFRESAIVVADDLVDLRTTDSAGDIQDTRVDVVRSITGAISAFNIARSTFDVDNTINRIDAVNLSGSSIIAGRLLTMAVANGIRTSAISISGPLETVTADSIVSTSISVTGPDGRLDNITVRGLFDGSILSTGPVGRLESTQGDIRGRLETRTARGTVDTIIAARDVDLETDISASLRTLRAGRHIGDIDAPKILLVRDDLQDVDVSNGALYSDIRVGDNLTGVVTIGAVPARPDQNLVGNGSVEAFGRINRVSVTGDFGGSVVSHSGGIGLVDITDGSFLAGGAIIAYDGDIAEVRITRGHLFGNIHADDILYLVEVTPSEDGVFGDIGVNPALSGFRASADPNRHELPPGVGVRTTKQGPTISAGRNIGRISVTGGSVFETTFVAGQAIGVIDIAGSFRNDTATTGFQNHIVAGNSVARVNIGGEASDLIILAGLIDLGPDGRPGGTGEDADLMKSGRVGMPGDGATGVFIGGNARDVTIAAGIVAGADGVYNTADDRHTLGLSYISNVQIGGSVTDVSAHADSHVESVTAGVTTGGDNTPVVGNVLEPVTQAPGEIGTVLTPGAAFNFTHGADSGTILYTGPGTAVWDAAGGRLVLINTTMQTDVTVTSDSGHLSSFRIVSNDDASVGRLEINSNLRGASDIYIDGYAREVVINGEYSGSGSIGVGNDIQLFRTGAFRTTGAMSAVFVREFDVNGAFGGASPTSPGTLISPTVTVFGVQNVSIDGGFRGVFSADRDIGGSFTVGGTMLRGFVRSGGSIGSFQAPQVRESFISARNSIGLVTVAGDVFDTSIIAGGDLGRDARFGGVGPARDVVSTGSVGPVNIGGTFVESDVVAGLLRGPDGFYGTSDDIAASGRSNVGQVTIGGTSLGSTRDTESYGVYATGSIAGVTAAGQGVTQRLNFRVQRHDTRPVPIQVTNLEVVEDAREYTARLTFNQPMNASTLVDGVIVNEVRAPGVTIRLQEGLDYDLEYDPSTNTALVHFRRDVTDRDLPLATGLPGPGVYRFTLDPNVVRAQVNSARMDGDGDGFADDRPYSADTIVGDAGDKVDNQQLFVPDGAGGEKQIDFRGAIDLDIILDDNFVSDSLPDPNTVFRIQGAIGDHQDAEAEIFSFSGDVDVYKITLQAGQILRLSPSEGSAIETERWLYASSGAFQSPFGVNGQSVALPTGFPLAELGSLATGQNYLITVTGQYYLVVGNDPLAEGPHTDPGRVNDYPPSPRRVGSYAFDLEVFDDGDTGFSATTDAGDGKRVPNAPPPAAFDGPDGTPGTGDDIAQIVTGNFTFTVNRQTGVVTGTDGGGVVSQRLADGRQLLTVDSNIGGPGAAGLPGSVRPDLDIYHLNDRQAIQAGTRMRVTIRLTDEGSDLGNRQLIPELQRESLGVPFLGDVQLAVFDTGPSTGIGDGQLVVSPSDFAPTGRDPGTIASDGSTTYGYDEQGDFFVEFLAPATTTYAVYLQGVYNAEYTLEVVQQSTRPQPSAFHGPDSIAGTPDDLTNINIGRFRYTLSGGQVTGALIPISQNVFLEFNGGEIDWLEAGGLTTNLRPFSARGFGFTGSIDGVPVDNFIKGTVVDKLNEIFQGAGYDVVFSRNPSQFEFEDYSTVYIADTEDPVSTFFDRFFGFSEHVDVLNADRNDDAVVFTPELSVLNYNPSPQEVRDFTDSLTAAVGRRVGELLGLRSTGSAFAAPQVDLFSSSSVAETPTLGGRYVIPGFARPLSTGFDSISDTNFYLGVQNSGSLLDRILGG
jgi:hypothetical protein